MALVTFETHRPKYYHWGTSRKGLSSKKLRRIKYYVGETEKEFVFLTEYVKSFLGRRVQERL